jgi:hypothetical protein
MISNKLEKLEVVLQPNFLKASLTSSSVNYFDFVKKV